MARSRNIKPGFFTNELLVELPFEHRLLFIGLWTIADREGRLDDRPKQIKIKLFPADSLDVDAGLAALADLGFILRYEAAGLRFIQVQNWRKHQQPHFKEKASTIPAPGQPEALDLSASTQSPGQEPDKPEASPKPAALIPDSLQSDSLQKDLSGKPDRADDFSTWYKAYPRHEARDDALKAWDKRRKAGELPPLAFMLNQIEWQVRDGCLKPATADGRSLVPLPATYLNKGKFKDEPPATHVPPPPRHVPRCIEPGCKEAGAPIWGGRCAVHHAHSQVPKRVAA